MTPNLASAITKAATKQTWYTIRFLVDRPRVDDAYRAYAYFRWVDDILDDATSSGPAECEEERAVRLGFLARQQELLNACLGGHEPAVVDPHEAMLVELVRSAGATDERLDAYLRHMMLVMDFDARRRGRLVTGQELDNYTRWLAIAVTEAMHYFIGHDTASPRDETRYLAVSGAHVVHMLRDTYADVRAGYFNVPREVLEASSIGPDDIRCDAYRRWVKDRARLGRAYLDAGKGYFRRVESRRHRLAGLAYIARFEWVLDALEHDHFTVRQEYAQPRSVPTAVRMAAGILPSLVLPRSHGRGPDPVTSTRDGRA
jgi:hypothetical protein